MIKGDYKGHSRKSVIGGQRERDYFKAAEGNIKVRLLKR